MRLPEAQEAQVSHGMRRNAAKSNAMVVERKGEAECGVKINKDFGSCG